MTLPGVKPEKITKRLKALFYGGPSAGKTTASIQFPSPYLIDTEKGAENDEYVEKLKKSDGIIYQTTDFDDVMKAVKILLTESHDRRTLIIDPMTTIYNDLVDKFATKVGTDFGRHVVEANKKIKQLFNLLVRLDMNVILTSHAKTEYGLNMAVIGQTFDCYKKLDYLFDLVFEVQKRGKERVGIVRKTRVKGFEESDQFNFCYEEIAKRYGKDILERSAVSEELATVEQITELERLIELMKVPDDVTQKWRDKCNCDKWDEMPRPAIQKCIEHLNLKIQGVAA